MTLEYSDPTNQKVDKGNYSAVIAAYPSLGPSCSTPTPIDDALQKQPARVENFGRGKDDSSAVVPTATTDKKTKKICAGLVVFAAIAVIVYIGLGIAISISLGRFEILAYMFIVPVALGLYARNKLQGTGRTGEGWSLERVHSI